MHIHIFQLGDVHLVENGKNKIRKDTCAHFEFALVWAACGLMCCWHLFWEKYSLEHLLTKNVKKNRMEHDM